MLNVIATIKVKEPQFESFKTIFKANIPAVLNEQGCIEYAATQDYQTEIPIQVMQTNTVTVIEKWESLPQMQAHLSAPHMLEYRSKVKGMVESVELRVLESI